MCREPLGRRNVTWTVPASTVVGGGATDTGVKTEGDGEGSGDGSGEGGGEGDGDLGGGDGMSGVRFT